MKERQQFVADWAMDARVGRVNLAALCRAYGISRQTGYKWLSRYLAAHGRIEALADRSRRPHTSPEAIPDDLIDLLIKARKARPYWGPVTLRQWLVNRGEEEQRLPAPSTIGSILERTAWSVAGNAAAARRPLRGNHRSKQIGRTPSGASTTRVTSAPPMVSSAIR